jgi:hypothetical protein
MLKILLVSFLALQDAKPGPSAWDTGQPSPEPYSAAALGARNGWTELQAPGPFKGDGVLTNGRLTLVVRRQGGGLDLYGAGERQARLSVDGSGAPALVEAGKGGVCVEAGGVKFRLKRGEIAVEAQPGPDAKRIRVECPSRYVVLPDFFADDLVVDAAKVPAAKADLPSENFVLHLAGKGGAVAAVVFENREQDVGVTLSGEGDRRVVESSEVEFGKGQKVWVGLLEAAGVWHSLEVRAEDAKKVVPLGWKRPFPAQWRLDFTRQDGLTDSWEMLNQKAPGGDFLKPAVLGSGSSRIPADRKRWTTVLGSFRYPCWIDAEGQGFIEPLAHRALTLRGPAVLYPINRMPETPLETFTVVDVMRNTLGVGPCEYILDLEGQKSEYKGRATCSVRDTLNPIYQKGKQKEQRATVDRTLDEGLTFVKHIRGRIERYQEFGRTLRAWLGDQKKARPELAGPIGDLEQLAGELETRYAARREKIKTPEHVAKMNEDFRRDVLGNEAPDAPEKCKAYATALVEIGDNQDELSGECRWVLKSLRQKAGLLMVAEPKMAAIAEEVRKRAQEAMKNPAGHEGARH